VSAALPTRRDAIAAVLDAVDGESIVVLANGLISREGYAARHRERNFYMLGSMGLAGAISLGIALARPDAPSVVLDGDGNLLMGMSVLPMVGAWQPRCFLHVVLDNGTYGSTGGQPSVSEAADFCGLALNSGYRRAETVGELEPLRRRVREWLSERGPSLLHVTVAGTDARKAPPRVPEPPIQMAARLTAALAAAG
jgi:thiamine pyrophosphate-dependent acetolactate synthase large subunit-like protein